MTQRRTQGFQESLEAENDELVDGLSHKVNALKSITISIGDEVRSHNELLRGLDNDADSSGGLLGASMKRVKELGRAGHNRWMCYMLIFILFVFFVIYVVIKWF